MKPKDSRPRLSVVVVSDYEAREQKTWAHERRILQALAGQDLGEPFDVLLVENAKIRGLVPDELHRICPRLEIIFADELQSAALKDVGVRCAQTEYVAVLEADCLPNPVWLRVLLEALCEHPEFSIAGGRTTYGDESMYRRCLSVLDRSFDDLGRPGETSHVSNNGALYRRAVIAAFPYPDSVSPFRSSRLRTLAMSASGHRFYFEPRAVMRHAIGGADFICDFRRNTAYADMMEQSSRRLRAVARVLWGRFRTDCADCFRVGPRYLRGYDWPLLILLLAVTPLLEIPGLRDAIHDRTSIPNSSYR